jgi:hypothetical protein
MLHKLGQEFPEVLLQNPGFDLMLVEHPEIPAALVPALLSVPAVLERLPFLAPEQQVLSVRISVASHVRVQPEILERLAVDADVKVRREVAKNINLPRASLDVLGIDRDEMVRTGVAANPNIPENLAAQLSVRESFFVLEKLMDNPGVSIGIRSEARALLRWLEIEQLR